MAANSAATATASGAAPGPSSQASRRRAGLLGLIGLVLVGGTIGTALREAIALAWPQPDPVNWPILVINVTGAFALGVLFAAVARRGEDRPVPRALRTGLGTGVLGGFTTYSTLSVDAAGLLGHGRPGPAVGYALATVLLGALATWCGILVGSLTPQPRNTPPPRAARESREDRTEHTPGAGS